MVTLRVEMDLRVVGHNQSGHWQFQQHSTSLCDCFQVKYNLGCINFWLYEDILSLSFTWYFEYITSILLTFHRV